MTDRTNERLAFIRNTKTLKALLSQVGSLAWLGFADALHSGVTPSMVWQKINRFDNLPPQSIKYDAPYQEVSDWLIGCLQATRVKQFCYLAIGGLGLPWSRVVIPNEAGWLLDLWRLLANKDLLILTADETSLLGFIEDEYRYEAYLLTMGDILKTVDSPVPTR